MPNTSLSVWCARLKSWVFLFKTLVSSGTELPSHRLMESTLRLVFSHRPRNRRGFFFFVWALKPSATLRTCLCVDRRLAPAPPSWLFWVEKSLSCPVKDCFLGTVCKETERRRSACAEPSVAQHGSWSCPSPYASFVQMKMGCLIQVDVVAAPVASSASCSHSEPLLAAPLGRWIPFAASLVSQPLMAAELLGSWVFAVSFLVPFPLCLRISLAGLPELVTQIGFCILHISTRPGHRSLLFLSFLTRYLVPQTSLPCTHPYPRAMVGSRFCLWPCQPSVSG